MKLIFPGIMRKGMMMHYLDKKNFFNMKKDFKKRGF